MDIFLWGIAICINIGLGYLGVALSDFKERQKVQKQEHTFLKWLPVFFEETKAMFRGTEQEGKIATKPDRTILFPVIFIMSLVGFSVFLASLLPLRKRHEKKLNQGKGKW